MTQQEVYLDITQCKRFRAPYTGPGRISIAASTLLESKGGDGYDAAHRQLLAPLGDATLVLVRGNSGPGWFKIEVVIDDLPPITGNA